MSKIGRANLNLQEQAEELGFETVQSALDCGYKAVLCKDGEMKLVQDADAALLEAHKKWEAKKNLIVDELTMLLHDTPYEEYKRVIKETIKFIQEGEV